jgi:hypothetical protein
MALIKCPECNRDVSDSAEMCPHCGYKVKKHISYCPYCDILKKEKVLMTFSVENNEYTYPQCNRTVGVATPEQEAMWAAQKQVENNIPKCPTCSSTNITRISAASKVINAGTFDYLAIKERRLFTAIIVSMSGKI